MMLMSVPTNGGHLMGGDPNVQALQQALTNLAQASGRPAINPGPISGVMNDSTVAAVAAGLQIMTEELPSWLYLVLQAALVAGSATSKAKTIVTQYAGQLTIAANAAAAKIHPATSGPARWASTPTDVAQFQPMQPTVTSTVTQMFAPGWYKTPIGIAIIALGLFGVYKLFIAPPKPAAQ